MIAYPTDSTSKPEPSPQIRMAVAKVLLGEPPAAVAADLGCNVISLMRWVKAQRRELKKAVRVSADADAPREPAEPVRLHAMRPMGGRVLPNDRPVEPEDSTRVAAAYRAAEFDYSGRRIRPATH